MKRWGKYCSSNESRPSVKTLIIEDNSSDLIAPYTMTNNLGHDVRIAFDGEMALIELHKENPDFIILDWNLPVLSGEEFLKALEKRNGVPKNAVSKIILHSSEDLDFNIFRNSVNFEVVDIWKKPITPLQMLKRLKVLTQIMRKYE